MPKMRKTLRLRNCAGERSNIITTTASEREVDCYLHGMRPEEKVVNGSNWLRNGDRTVLVRSRGMIVDFEPFDHTKLFDIVLLNR
jgi:hypothetical protein